MIRSLSLLKRPKNGHRGGPNPAQSAPLPRMCYFVRVQKTPKFRYKGQLEDLSIDTDNRVYLNFSERLLNQMALICAPKPEETRQMLLQLRTACEWPQARLAAVLGVPGATLRKWETGERRPSSAAKKLIWLLHTILVKKERIPTDLHIAAWGQQWGFLDLAKLRQNDPP